MVSTAKEHQGFEHNMSGGKKCFGWDEGGSAVGWQEGECIIKGEESILSYTRSSSQHILC